MLHRNTKPSNSRGERGQSLVETALVVPFLLLLIVLVVDASRAFDAFIVLTNAAREGARYAAIEPEPTVDMIENFIVEDVLGSGTNITHMGLFSTGNVELAALFAPRPQAMTAADDWTRDMMTKGYPELQQLYALFGARDRVLCRPLLHFPHNYNYVTRATMYTWMNRHLQLGLEEPVVEEDFEPLKPDEYTVWNDEHPRPEGGLDYELALTKYLAEQSDRQLAAAAPTDAGKLQQFRELVGGAVQTLIGRDELPDPEAIVRTMVDKQQRDGYLFFKDILRLESQGEELPVISLYPTSTQWNGEVVIWLDGAGKRGMFQGGEQPRAEVRRLLDGGVTVLGADLFQQGEFLLTEQPLEQQRVVANPREFAGYTFGYNNPLLARRVHDVLTLVSFVRNDEHAPKSVSLVGVGGAAPVAVAARAIAGGAIDRLAVDTAGFRFVDLQSYRHPDFLPGAVKYGDLPALLALSAPNPLWIGGESGRLPEPVGQAYAAAGAPDQVLASPLQNVADAAVGWLLTK